MDIKRISKADAHAAARMPVVFLKRAIGLLQCMKGRRQKA